MIVTHQAAKRAGSCCLCGKIFYVKDLIVTWDKNDPLEPDALLAAHEECYANKKYKGGE